MLVACSDQIRVHLNPHVNINHTPDLIISFDVQYDLHCIDFSLSSAGSCTLY